MSVSVDSTPSVITIDSENKEVSVVSTPVSVTITPVSNTVDVTPIVNEVTIVAGQSGIDGTDGTDGTDGVDGTDGTNGVAVVKIRMSTDGSVDTSVYNSVVLTAECSITLTDNTDGTRVRVYNASNSNCVIVGTVEDVTDPIIYPAETFDMEYNSNELRWSV